MHSVAASPGQTPVVPSVIPYAPPHSRAFTVQQIVDDPGYPGADEAHRPDRVRHERVAPLRQEDLERFWLLEYRFPEGVTPLGLSYLDDGFAWATQQAADRVPLPTSNGLTVRLAGTHPYFTELEQVSAREAARRAERLRRTLPAFLDGFPKLWRTHVDWLETQARRFERHDPADDTDADLLTRLHDARAFQRRAWEIHFELMYPLILNQAGFYGLCAELGIGRTEVPRLLQGRESSITACDRALCELARALRGTALERVFVDHPAAEIGAALKRVEAREWKDRFDAFLDEWGWRTDSMADPRLPSWRESPVTPLGNLRTFLLEGSDPHDFGAALADARRERGEALAAIRSRLTRAERKAFDDGLATCEQANFVWWNEDHNHYIDLRATIPLRQAALEIARRRQADAVDDVFFLFLSELDSVARGAADFGRYGDLVAARRDFHAGWLQRRAQMPKYLGAAPDSISDPILIELDGVTDEFLAAVRAGVDSTDMLRGLGAAPGKGRGRARVLHSPQDLHEVQTGEVLVCEGTSPSWTPAFTRIAACVCDQGGTLAHASIVSREYRVPCVVGTAVATQRIRDGDHLEVDGDAGTVLILSGDGQ